MECITIGFTGNRYGLTENQKNEIINILDKYENIIVLHGDCVGSDTQFHNICLHWIKINPNKKLLIHIYPPNNPTLRAFNNGDLVMEEKTYLERNSNIIKNSSLIIACPKNKEKEELRSGTWSTIRRAKKEKKDLIIL